MITRTYAYGRFSTLDQEDNTSMENQMQTCHRYAESHGLTIVKEFKDDAVSGTVAMEYRPKGKEMIDAIKRGECDAVVVYVPDRANRDTLNALMLRKFLKRSKVQIHYTNLGLISGVNEILATLLDMMAENEVNQIRERTQKGRINRVKDQKKPVLSSYPYGYDKIGIKKDAYLVINQKEARIVQLIYEYYVYESYSLQAIAEYLNSQDISTRKNIIPSETKNGRGWYQRSICNILKNPMYKGLYAYGKTALKEKEYDTQKTWDRKYKVSEEDWQTLDKPELAIVSPELWQLAQERLEKNKEFTRWTSKNRGKFLLSGFIRCPYCNYKIGGVTHKYKLARQNGKVAERYCYEDHNRDCSAYGSSIAQHILDDLVWNWLIEQLGDEELTNAGIDRIQEKRNQDLASNIHQKDELVKTIDDISKQVQRLARSLARIEDEDASIAVENEISLLAKQKTNAEKKLHLLKAIIDENSIGDEERKAILKMTKEIKRRMEIEDLTVLKKRKLLEMIYLQVDFYRETERYVKVSWGFGPSTTLRIDDSNGSHVTTEQHLHTILMFETILWIDNKKQDLHPVSNILIEDNYVRLPLGV